MGSGGRKVLHIHMNEMNTDIGNKAYTYILGDMLRLDWIGFIDSYQGKKRNDTKGTNKYKYKYKYGG